VGAPGPGGGHRPAQGTAGEEAVACPDTLRRRGVEQENKQLKARIRELELERDILRRAAKYFAGETNW
jgi:transposase